MLRWLRIVAGLATLTALVVGVPLILIRTAGWPLPSSMPAVGDVTTRIGQGDIQAEAVVNTLAVIVWIVWAQFMWAVLWETIVNVPRLMSGRRWRPAPLVLSPVGDGVARLFSVILAVGVLSTTTASTTTALTLPSGPTMRDATAAVVVVETPNAATVQPVESGAATRRQVRWHTTPEDDLWGIAQAALGDGSRVDEIVTLNPGLTARLLRSGMVIELPGDANVPDSRTATRPADIPQVNTDAETDTTQTVAGRYVVRDNDGMWTVAEALVGDGDRHVEVATMLDGQEVAPGVRFDASQPVIHPGWVFTLTGTDPAPSAAPASAATRHVVTRGESLWDIAGAELGDATRWTEIWELHAGRVMNDGRVFTDANVIQPGWELEIPTTQLTTPTPPPVVAPQADDDPTAESTDSDADPVGAPDVVAASTPTVEDDVTSTTAVPPAERPGAAQTRSPVSEQADAEATSAVDTADIDDAGLVTVRDRRPMWMLGLTGATVLSSGLWAVSAWYRRRAGARGASRLHERNTSSQMIDEALRASADQPLLGWANVTLGDLVAKRGINAHGALPVVVKLSPEEGLTVQWEPPLPAEPLDGWRISGDGRHWHLPAADDAVLATPGPVAVPGLATIGRCDRSEVLIDLESCGSLAVYGDGALSESLVRSIVLELGAGGPLSSAQVHTVGLDIDGVEQLDRVRSRSEQDAIEHLRTIRVQHDEVLDNADRASMIEVRAAFTPIGRELTVVAVRAAVCVRLDELLECAAPQRGVAVIVLGEARCATTIRVDGDRTATLAPLDVVVEAAGVPRQSAAAVAVHLDRVSAALNADALSVPRAVETVGDDGLTQPATLVRVLGVPAVDDADGLGWRELEIAAFIAANDASTTDDILIDAVFCGRAERGVVWDLISRLRAGAPQLLAAQNHASNTIALADGVMSDVAWMDCLIGRSHGRNDDAAIGDLVSALSLVTGIPFNGPAGCEWAITGGDLAAAMESIERTALLLTDRSIAADEFTRARDAIGKVMGAVGPNEQLTRTLMRLEHAAGNESAVQDAYGDLSFDLSDLSGPSDVVTPTTATTNLLERPAVLSVAGVEPAEPADIAPVRQTQRPRVMLRTFGEVCVEGSATTQALSVAFAVAAAGRAMPGAELAELTGYSPKSLSTVFTVDNDIVDRDNGQLRLSSGVWTDHRWMLECARKARSADEAGDVHDVSDWLRHLFGELARIDASPYTVTPGKKTYWRWVDDFPVDVSARQTAENQLVEAALVGTEVWNTAAAQEHVPAEVVVRTLNKLAQVVPYAAVASAVRPSEFQSGAENLLLAAHDAASGRGELTNSVQAVARRLVAGETIDASDMLADALGL